MCPDTLPGPSLAGNTTLSRRPGGRGGFGTKILCGIDVRSEVSGHVGLGR